MKPKQLIKEIVRLRSGILTSYSAAMRFPVCIINVIHADMSGVIWFIIRKPYECTEGLNESFHAKLDMYNSKFDYYVEATGTAWLHRPPKEFHGLPNIVAELIDSDNQAAISFNLSQAIYHRTIKKPNTILGAVREFLLKIVLM